MDIEENANYPHCTLCSNYLSIRIIQKEIQLYCLQCSYFKNYKDDNQLLSKIFSEKNIQTPTFIQDIKCKLCKNMYCSSCYNYHQDCLSHIQLKPKMDFCHAKLRRIINQRYTNHSNIKCEKCKKNYNSSMVLINNDISSFQIIQRNFQKAYNYYNSYVCNLKNNIIDELKYKMNLIEEAFKENFEYQIFSLCSVHYLNLPK